MLKAMICGLVSWSLRSTSYPGQGEGTPQEHCLEAAAANQNTKLTHSRAQTANQSSTMDTFWTDPGSDFQNKYTAEHGRLHRESNQISQWLQKWIWRRLLQAEKGGGEGGAGGSFSLFFLSGHLRLGYCHTSSKMSVKMLKALSRIFAILSATARDDFTNTPVIFSSTKAWASFLPTKTISKSQWQIERLHSYFF